MSKRKTVRPGVRETSPVSIYGEVYGRKRLEEEVLNQSVVGQTEKLGWMPLNILILQVIL